MVYHRILNIVPAFISAWDLVLNVFSHQQDQRDGTPDITQGVLLDSREKGKQIQVFSAIATCV